MVLSNRCGNDSHYVMPFLHSQPIMSYDWLESTAYEAVIGLGDHSFVFSDLFN